jgi:hypothetical protein
VRCSAAAMAIARERLGVAARIGRLSVQPALLRGRNVLQHDGLVRPCYLHIAFRFWKISRMGGSRFATADQRRCDGRWSEGVVGATRARCPAGRARSPLVRFLSLSAWVRPAHYQADREAVGRIATVTTSAADGSLISEPRCLTYTHSASAVVRRRSRRIRPRSSAAFSPVRPMRKSGHFRDTVQRPRE